MFPLTNASQESVLKEYRFVNNTIIDAISGIRIGNYHDGEVSNNTMVTTSSGIETRLISTDPNAGWILNNNNISGATIVRGLDIVDSSGGQGITINNNNFSNIGGFVVHLATSALSGTGNVYDGTGGGTLCDDGGGNTGFITFSEPPATCP